MFSQISTFNYHNSCHIPYTRLVKRKGLIFLLYRTAPYYFEMDDSEITQMLELQL